jgi:rhamnosyltransferase
MHATSFSVGVVVPTLNAAKNWPAFHAGLAMQTLALKRVLIVDTCSTDGTADAARLAGYDVVSVQRSEFNHGGTRQKAATLMADVDVLVYLTQDAILASPDSLANLVALFEDPSMGATYGRQLPRKGAGVLEAHARHFNYPAKSVVRDLQYRKEAGFKAIFASNSFAAYRAHALRDVGGFPTDVVVSEETVVFARLLLSGWKTAYAGDATVFHSHNYGVFESMQRYFDIGVVHARESWILEEFGHVGGEGKRFLLSELKALWPSHLYLLPLSGLQTIAKLLGYQLGLRERSLDRRVSRYLSQQKNLWV